MLGRRNIIQDDDPGFTKGVTYGIAPASSFSLSPERVRGHEMFTSEWVLEWIKENQIELVICYDLI